MQGIKKTKDKALVEVINAIGRTFCRDHFCEVGKETFYTRYGEACDKARSDTIKEAQETASSTGAKLIKNDTELLVASLAGSCRDLASTKLQAYKEVSVEEAARYASSIVEDSNKKYLQKAHEQFNKFIDKVNTVQKMFGDIARAFQ